MVAVRIDPTPQTFQGVQPFRRRHPLFVALDPITGETGLSRKEVYKAWLKSDKIQHAEKTPVLSARRS